MIIESLTFHLKPRARKLFVQRNERIWTPALAARGGFVTRQLLLPDDDPDQVVILVHWRSIRQMEAFPPDLEQQLDREMGDLVVHRERRIFHTPPPDQAPPV